MKRVQLILSCVLLTTFITFPHYSGASAGANTSAQANKAARAKRQRNIIDLKSIEPVKEAFQRDSGKVRLVMILSPT